MAKFKARCNIFRSPVELKALEKEIDVFVEREIKATRNNHQFVNWSFLARQTAGFCREEKAFSNERVQFEMLEEDIEKKAKELAARRATIESFDDLLSSSRHSLPMLAKTNDFHRLGSGEV